MTVEDATMTDEHNEEFLCDGTQSIDSITDMRKASGLEAMEYAEQHMPVLRDTMDSLTTRVDFSGIRIAVCLILEPKTAILLRKLKAAGAIVGVYCGPDSTDPRVAEQLRREGITGRIQPRLDRGTGARGGPAPAGRNTAGHHHRRWCQLRPSRFARTPRTHGEPHWSGRGNDQRRTRVPADAGSGSPHLPVVAVNDSVLKTGFDNAHGTGETCVTTMQRILGEHAFDGKNVTVIGYGPVGQASHGAFARLAPKSPSAISIQWLHSKRCSTASPHKTLTRHSLARIWWCPPLA